MVLIIELGSYISQCDVIPFKFFLELHLLLPKLLFDELHPLSSRSLNFDPERLLK